MEAVRNMVEELKASIQKRISEIPDKRERKKVEQILKLALENKISKEEIKKLAME